ncbi:MAG: hypothetical protein R3E79_07480 [Caldilineaceae bacterium]
MKVERKPRDYYNRFADKPVAIKPFDPESKQQALHYLVRLNALRRLGSWPSFTVPLPWRSPGREWEFALCSPTRNGIRC